MGALGAYFKIMWCDCVGRDEGGGRIGAGGGISKGFVMRKVKSMYAGTPRNTFPLTTIRYHPDAIQ